MIDVYDLLSVQFFCEVLRGPFHRLFDHIYNISIFFLEKNN